MTSEHDSITTDYTANGLNQYPIASTPDVSQGMRYDAAGNMVESFVAGDMDCDGDVDFSDIDCLVAVLGSCPPNPDPYACDPCDCINGDMDGDGDLKVEFSYDYRGRRVRKLATPWNPLLNGGAGDWDSANADLRKYLWSGWKMLIELDDQAEAFNKVRKYTGGLDLAGQNRTHWPSSVVLRRKVQGRLLWGTRRSLSDRGALHEREPQ